MSYPKHFRIVRVIEIYGSEQGMTQALLDMHVQKNKPYRRPRAGYAVREVYRSTILTDPGEEDPSAEGEGSPKQPRGGFGTNGKVDET
jgi:hypothetical protein